MVLIKTRKTSEAPNHVQHRQRIRKAVGLAVSYAASAVAAAVSSSYLDKIPMHTSSLTGLGWLNELLKGHPARFHHQMGMSKLVFRKLVHALEIKCGLSPSKHITSEEQVAIFLRIARTGLGNREHQERFQRSGDTISKYFHRILRMIVSPAFYNSYVKLPSANVPPEIRNNPHYWPYFKDCLGAVDGSLLDAFVSMADMARFRSRKGRISQSLLAACCFNLLFCYILSGWEGRSAADGRVFEDARNKGFAIPSGKYYLGDAGFPACDSLLVPYRGVRYHLNEWRKAGNLKPANPKELFNLRHARLRNAIERIFGVCKRRFKLMTAAPEYSIATQAMIPCALAALHNFITIHDPDDFADEGLLDGQRGPRDTSWTLLKEYNGNLNFTTNAWTSPNHWAFIAIMVHLEMNGEPVSLLLDLVEVAESHNGLNLAVVFAGILDDYGIADKILSITCDNMSANDGMINELFKIVLWFEGQKDRVRCFAHIINLVAKSLLKQFDVPKGKEGDTMSDAEQQLAELAKDLDMEDLQTRLETSARENDDDDVEGWVNEVEEMSEAKRKAHNANIQPVSLVIVKVSTDTIYGDL
ncbi:hypothetical protein HGRIS_014896 [Hohenbuehelia grisea]|uniref:DDE Tnp4 domain-containing protein n=1 Tax=Hohenbuehelia grisea TaxID=104357 RepID=A0ABR3JP17_9AGAR